MEAQLSHLMVGEDAFLLLSRDAFDRIVGELRGTGWDRFSVAQFKDRFALSRKWAIPLFEHLEPAGVTRRAGDDRLLVAPKTDA